MLEIRIELKIRVPKMLFNPKVLQETIKALCKTVHAILGAVDIEAEAHVNDFKKEDVVVNIPVVMGKRSRSKKELPK